MLKSRKPRPARTRRLVSPERLETRQMLDGDSNEPLVAVVLSVVDGAGQPLSTIEVGQPFFLTATVDDLRPDGDGVFSAYVDVDFQSGLASVSGPLTFGDNYPNAREGSAATAGRIDEAGAVAGTTFLDEEPRLLFRVPLTATAAGELTFVPTLADLLPDHETTLYNDRSVVPDDQVLLLETSLTVLAVLRGTADTFTIFPDDSPATFDVLANDAAPPAVSSLTIEAVTTPTRGGLVEINGTRLEYTPAAGFYGTETFTYTLLNEFGQTATAEVTVQVRKLWHNPVLTTDVTGDDATSPIDALQIINILNTTGAGPLPAIPPASQANFFLDVNDDGSVTVQDALLVIAELNRRATARGGAQGEFAPPEGEPESAHSSLFAETEPFLWTPAPVALPPSLRPATRLAFLEPRSSTDSYSVSSLPEEFESLLNDLARDR